MINPESLRRVPLGAFRRRLPYIMPASRSIDLDTLWPTGSAPKQCSDSYEHGKTYNIAHTASLMEALRKLNALSGGAMTLFVLDGRGRGARLPYRRRAQARHYSGTVLGSSVCLRPRGAISAQ